MTGYEISEARYYAGAVVLLAYLVALPVLCWLAGRLADRFTPNH